MNKVQAKCSKKETTRTYDFLFKSVARETYSTRQDTQSKYKTELCRNLESGFCEFGENCFFAHSLEEIRGKSGAISIRKEKCKEYFELGYCINGSKCQHSHRDNSPDTAANSPNASRKPSRKGSEDSHKIPIFFDLESRSIF